MIALSIVVVTRSFRVRTTDSASSRMNKNNVPAGHPPQHASNGIGGGLSPHFAGSLQPRHSVKHASVVSKKYR